MGFLPKTRREGIITKEVDGELLVYDIERDKAHCLNPSAAAIWKLCDGRTSIEEIAASMTTQTGAIVDEIAVSLALADFGRSHLLEVTGGDEMRLQLPKTILGMSRREAVKRIGIGASLPIIFSITAPTAQANISCKGDGVTCGAGPECCSGTCTSNQCVGPFGP
jgi:hypothetical protein